MKIHCSRSEITNTFLSLRLREVQARPSSLPPAAPPPPPPTDLVYTAQSIKKSLGRSRKLQSYIQFLLYPFTY